MLALRLRSTANRINSEREELRVIDEQWIHLEDEADQQAMSQHRAHVVADIARLNAKLDRLLDGRPR